MIERAQIGPSASAGTSVAANERDDRRGARPNWLALALCRLARLMVLGGNGPVNATAICAGLARAREAAAPKPVTDAPLYESNGNAEPKPYVPPGFDRQGPVLGSVLIVVQCARASAPITRTEFAKMRMALSAALALSVSLAVVRAAETPKPVPGDGELQRTGPIQSTAKQSAATQSKLNGEGVTLVVFGKPGF